MLTREKKTLTLADIDAQSALELPSRETLALVNVVITNVTANVLNNNTVTVNVVNNRVAVQVCALVNLINTIIAPTTLTCTINQP
jgi:hypothetical protein